MTYGETLTLIRAMAQSGEAYSFPDCVDKHLTGGVGDKIGLTSLPFVAACAARRQALQARPRHDGRHERQAGVDFGPLRKPLRRAVLAPGPGGRARHHRGRGSRPGRQGHLRAGRHYRNRRLPLLVSSIVSKKAATGAGRLIYGVIQTGSGTFDEDAGRGGPRVGRPPRPPQRVHGHPHLRRHNRHGQPSGSAVGNALEVRALADFLRGNAVPQDLADEAGLVGTRLLKLKEEGEPERSVGRALFSGGAYE